MSAADAGARANRAAAVIAAGACALGVVRLVQGHLPERLDRLIPEIGPPEVQELVLIGLFILVAVVAGPRLIPWILGLPRRRDFTVRRELLVPPHDAEALVNRALSRLIERGFTSKPLEILADGGWRTVASRGGLPTTLDFARAGQNVEFLFASGQLTVAHGFRSVWGRCESGEMDYQEWLLGALLSDVPAGPPPRRLSDSGIIFFPSALFLAVVGAVYHFSPDDASGAWLRAYAVTYTIGGGVVAGVCSLALLFEGRKVAGRGLFTAGVMLAALGAYLFSSRPTDWRTLGWKESDDPALLCRVAFSAWRDNDARESKGIDPTDRELKLVETRTVARRRLLAMGPRAVSAMICMKTDDRQYDYWAGEQVRGFGQRALPVLLAALTRPEPFARRRAASWLRHFPGNPEVERRLVAALRDPEPRVRMAALDACSSRAPWEDELHRALTDLLDDPDRRVRGLAISAAGTRRVTRAVPRLRTMLTEATEDDRHSILWSLLNIGDPQALPDVMSLGLKESYHATLLISSFGVAAIDPLLDQLETPQAQKAHEALRCERGFIRETSDAPRGLDLPEATLRRLLALADHGDTERRATALWVLARSSADSGRARAGQALSGPEAWCVIHPLRRHGLATVDDLARCLDLDARAVERHVFNAVTEEDQALAEKLLSIAKDGSRPASIRRRALVTLSYTLKREDEAVAAAEGLIADGDRELRATAVGMIRNPVILISLLGDKDETVRSRAFSALGKQSVPEARQALARIFAEDPSPAVRTEAAFSLLESRSPAAVAAFCEILSRDGHARLEKVMIPHALRVLGEIGDPSARPALREALRRARDRNDAATYRSAARALGMTGDREVIPILRQAARRGDGEAVRAFGRMGGVGAAHLLEILDEADSTDAVEALAETGSSLALPRLLDLLESPDSRLRLAAANALSRLGDDGAVSALARALEDPDEQVAWAAIHALACYLGRAGEVTFHRDFAHARATVKSWLEGRPVETAPEPKFKFVR